MNNDLYGVFLPVSCIFVLKAQKGIVRVSDRQHLVNRMCIWGSVNNRTSVIPQKSPRGEILTSGRENSTIWRWISPILGENVSTLVIVHWSLCDESTVQAWHCKMRPTATVLLHQNLCNCLLHKIAQRYFSRLRTAPFVTCCIHSNNNYSELKVETENLNFILFG